MTPTTPAVPSPRDPARPYAVAVVCLGNICRSPMAHVVLEQKVDDAGLGEHVVVRSAGTGGWHVGESMDPRAADALRARGYDPSRHRAAQFDAGWYAEHDLVLAMDASNHEDLAALAPDDDALARLEMFRAWDPEADVTDAVVPDPWYGGEDGFTDVLDTVERTSERLVAALAEALPRS